MAKKEKAKKARVARVTVRFEVDITLSIPVSPSETDKDIVGKLCNKDLFLPYDNHLFGLNDDLLYQMDIVVEESYCYGDPNPTGRQHVYRDWEIDIQEEEEE